ncbi:AAWKG family protein [Streptomyces sp. NPDC101213]|uniref:AAWKG family protein n=1 Tax=Streptomyces sp. NPDC101213 TaxID=3366130 RepID=UPI0037F54DF4
MAGQYDPNSVANVDKFDDAGDPSSDTWATLVTHITGYPVPDRKTIFDTLRSDHGGKLFRMDIKERSLGLLVKDSGFLTNKGEDYDIWFFDGGKKRSIMQARIVFEGRVKVDDKVIFADPNTDDVNNAQVREGNEFKDYHGDKFSTIPLARYMNGPRAALMELLAAGASTEKARFSDLGVPAADVVDLNSFDTTGESFDYAAQFFKNHAVVLKDWEDRFGRDDASWKGEAAEVFRSLLTKIRENYDSYVETFNSSPTAADDTTTTTGSTVYSRALSLGRKYLEDSARELLKAWLEWAKSPYYDPHRVLRYVLDDLAQWVDTHNVANTEITSTTTRYGTTVRHSPKTGFTHVHPEYGDLTDIANWAKVGDKAVKIWTQAVDEKLGKAAATVQSNLNNHFLELGDDFSENVPEPKSTSTASQDYEERKQEEEKEEIKRQNEENRKYQDELREEQKRQREEDRKYQDELREEQKRQREEDRKYQDELREEQKREQEEAKRLQDELRNEQNQQRDEDRKYQDELREEQKREQEEAKREAEEQRKAVEQSLGGLNDPNALNQQNLGNLDDLLNGNNLTTESGGDLGGTGNGPGGANNAANDVINQNLGGLGNLNGGLGGGLGGSLKTPTGGRTQFDDGRLTTDFPDGSKTSFDPDTGVLTTTNPDGSTTTTDLGDGLKVTNPDGSVTSLGDDGKLTTTFPDGTVQTVDPATGQTVTTKPDGTTTTENLGSLDGLNSGLRDGVLDTPTGGSTELTSGGDVITDLPDGTRTSFDPDTGVLTTTNPDGSTTTTDLGDGLKVTNPDGSVTSLGDDGKLTTTFPDGTVQTVDPATGQTVTTKPDGTTTTENLGSLGGLNGRNSLGDLGDLGDLGNLGDINTDLPTESNGDLGDLGDLNGGDQAGLETPTGGHTALDDGDFTTTFADGSKATFDPDTGMLTTTRPDGTSTVTDLTHGAKVTNPDGSTTVLDNGQLNTTFPDGSKQSIDPETGVVTVTDPQGHTRTVDLHDLDPIRNSGGSDLSDLLDGLGGTGGGTTTRDLSLSDLGLGGGAGSTAGVGGGSTGIGGGLSGTDSLLQGGGATGGVAPLSDGVADSLATPLTAAATPGAPGAPGTPGTPGMPMGGMGAGGMGGGAEKGNGERVRAVLVDATEESERRNRRRRSAWHRQEDSDTFLAPASRVATTGGDVPEEEAEPGRRATSSADYLEEDADVWGTEEGGTPAVIGR